MSPKTLVAWFDENPAAVRTAKTWLRSGGSARSLVGVLQAQHDFPFSHTGVRKWAKQHAAGELAARSARKPPERFIRTDQDVKQLDQTTDLFVTSAVNNSPVCVDALRALEQATAECGGTILVNPVRYKNPTRRGEVREDEWWAPELVPYLLENEVRPHPLLSVMTTRVQATTANPLPARIDSRTKDRSAVFGHPQLSMRTVATPQNKLPKILYSSGAITERAYSDTLAGDMAQFHHSIAAVKIEVRGKHFHLREIVWDGTRFIDLDREYRPSGVYDAPRPDLIAFGDIHFGLEDPVVMGATFGPGGVVDTLKPRRAAFHDTFDGRKPNPHERSNALLRAIRAEHTVRGELRYWANAMNDLLRGTSFEEAVIVRSNHDEFLDRWLAAGAPEPNDAVLYHWLMYQMVAEPGTLEPRRGELPMALELILREWFELDPRIRFLQADESYRFHDVEIGMHGHLGPDGARGSPSNLARIGTKFIAGHRHSPCIWQGGYWVGLKALYRHGYNRGPSSWLQADCLLHANGMRQLISYVNEHWRG